MKNIKKVKERIEKLSYPYLQNLSDDLDISKGYLTLINEIAKKVYIKPTEISGTMSFSSLFDTYSASKESWKFYEENDDLKGYIHVQGISLSCGKAIKKFLLDENDIDTKDILSDKIQNQKGYIHIGSVVSKKYPLPYNNDLLYILIAGVIDRILELRELNPSLRFVLATAFEDTTGDNHFLSILPKYGFEYIGVNETGDTLYQMDLESTDRPFSELIEIVSKKRINFYKREKKINIFISKLTNFKRIKEIIDYLLKIYKKVK